MPATTKKDKLGRYLAFEPVGEVLHQDDLYGRVLEDGRRIGLTTQIYTYRLWVGDDVGYGWAFCYSNPVAGLLAALDWDGESDPLDGWHREIGGKCRRRDEEGNEYILR
jgi:hypothetical protein